MSLPQIRRAAIELTLHQLQAPADADIYAVINRLCPRGVYDLLPLTIHLAEACGALLGRDCGDRESAIAALRQQLDESDVSGNNA